MTEIEYQYYLARGESSRWILTEVIDPSTDFELLLTALRENKWIGLKHIKGVYDGAYAVLLTEKQFKKQFPNEYKNRMKIIEKPKEGLQKYPLCTSCLHYKEPWTCKAYPGGIPHDIFSEEALHDRVYNDQTGDFVYTFNEDNSILDI